MSGNERYWSPPCATIAATRQAMKEGVVSDILAAYKARSAGEEGEIRLRTDRVEWYWHKEPPAKWIAWALALFTLFLSLLMLLKKPKSQTIMLPLEQVSAAKISDHGHGASLVSVATSSGKLDFVMNSEDAHALLAGVYRQIGSR